MSRFLYSIVLELNEKRREKKNTKSNVATLAMLFSPILAIFGGLVGIAIANLDVITLVVPSGNYIQEASATLVLGDIPQPVTGDVALWSAIMMDRQDFLQGVTQNSPPGLYVPMNET